MASGSAGETWRVPGSRFGSTGDRSECNDTEIGFDDTAVDGGTELRFTRAGPVASVECFDACRRGWSHYIGEVCDR